MFSTEAFHLQPRHSSYRPDPEVPPAVNISASRRIGNEPVGRFEVCKHGIVPLIHPALCAEPHVLETVPHDKCYDAGPEFFLHGVHRHKSLSVPPDDAVLCREPECSMSVLADRHYPGIRETFAFSKKDHFSAAVESAAPGICPEPERSICITEERTHSRIGNPLVGTKRQQHLSFRGCFHDLPAAAAPDGSMLITKKPDDRHMEEFINRPGFQSAVLMDHKAVPRPDPDTPAPALCKGVDSEMGQSVGESEGCRPPVGLESRRAVVGAEPAVPFRILKDRNDMIALQSRGVVVAAKRCARELERSTFTSKPEDVFTVPVHCTDVLIGQ